MRGIKHNPAVGIDWSVQWKTRILPWLGDADDSDTLAAKLSWAYKKTQ